MSTHNNMENFAVHLLIICMLLIGCGKSGGGKTTANNEDAKAKANADVKANADARLLLKNAYDSAILRMPIALQCYWEHIHKKKPAPLPKYRQTSNGGQYLVQSKDDIGGEITWV